MSKYNAVKTEVAGIKFDSKAEALRYGHLIMLERTGAIYGLMRQVPYVLAPSVRLHGSKRAKPALRYYVDFLYFEKDGRMIAEDVKGVVTPLFRIKQHLMATVHGIHVRVVS